MRLRLGPIPAFLTVTGLALAATPVTVAAASRAKQPSPRALLSAAVKDNRALESFTFSARVTDKTGKSRLTGTIAAPGRAHLTLRQGRGLSEIIVIGRADYTKLNAAAWRTALGKGSKIDDKYVDQWMHDPASNGSSETAEWSPTVLATCALKYAGKLTRTGTATVDGVKTVIITDRGTKKGATPRRYYVASAGIPRLMRVVQTGKLRAGGKKDRKCKPSGDTTRWMDMRLTAFNEPAVIIAPESSIRWPF